MRTVGLGRDRFMPMSIYGTEYNLAVPAFGNRQRLRRVAAHFRVRSRRLFEGRRWKMRQLKGGGPTPYGRGAESDPRRAGAPACASFWLQEFMHALGFPPHAR